MASEKSDSRSDYPVDIETSFRNSATIGEFVTRYLDYFTFILSKIDVDIIERIINVLEGAAVRDNTIFMAGNGGSAATASHMANDLAFGASLEEFPPFRVQCLSDNVPIITAVANDIGYSKIFVKQLEGRVLEGDVFIAFSVSGNSPNIIEAVNYAKQQGAVTIGCGGFDGGKLRRKADIYLHIESKPGEYGPVEDAMMILDHLIYSYFLLSRKGTLKRTP